MTNSDAKNTAGEDVLKEAMKLLDGLEFDSVRGGTARTENLFLSVVPDWEDGSRQTFRAALKCQAMWHREVDWQLMRVSARPKESSGFFVQHVLPLSTDGHATFEGLDAGTYSLRAYCRLVQFSTPEPGKAVESPRDVTRLASGVAMDSDSSAKGETEPLTSSEAETDEIVVLIGSRDKFVTLEFVTDEEKFAGKSLEFCIANPQTKEVYLDAQVAVFGTSPVEGEYQFRTGPIELSFSAGDDVDVSYRILG